MKQKNILKNGNPDSADDAEKEENFRSLSLFLFGAPPKFFEAFDVIKNINNKLDPTFLAFKQNLNSAIMVGNVPYSFAHSVIIDQRFTQILSAERIRMLSSNFDLLSKEDKEKTALDKTKVRMKGEMKDPKVISIHVKNTLRNLDDFLAQEDSFYSSQELLRQVLVMTWGALEVMCNDLLCNLLNMRPELIQRMSTASLFKDFPIKTVFSEALEKHSYNLSSVMGDVFMGYVRLDSLERIRQALNAVFCDETLERAMKEDWLWHLAQRRHLIVHRRSLIDAKYISHTGEDESLIGQTLSMDADYVEATLCKVRDLGLDILSKANTCL